MTMTGTNVQYNAALDPALDGAIDGPCHRYPLRVHYEDTDAGGVVYYANYLKFLERARTEALLTIGLSNSIIKDKFGAYIIVKSCNIDYKKPAYLEDNLCVTSYIKSVTKTSFLMNQTISKNDEIIADAQINLVFINENGKPIKIPDIIFKNFKPYFSDIVKS